jgi:hypothetical protein
MPSEVIYGPNGVHTRVSWGGEGQETIQLVTQAVTHQGAEPTERLIRIVNEWLDAAGMPQIDHAELVRRCSSPPFFDGWWATIDSWSQVNRLIKVLQRARNRSYGEPA